MQNEKVKITSTEILSNNRFPLKKISLEYRREDGASQTQSREVYDTGNGSAIMLYNKETRNIILTRQFRTPTFISGNADGLMIETCAGLLDGDSAEDCAKREAEEETGYRPADVKKVFEAYMSPGAMTEKLFFFIAAYDAGMKVSPGGGLAEEQEEIEVLEMNIDTAMEMVISGEIQDAKTIMLLQHIKLNKVL